MDWSDGLAIMALLQQLKEQRKPCRECRSMRVNEMIDPVRKSVVHVGCYDCGATYALGKLKERTEEAPRDQRREQLLALRRDGVDRRPVVPGVQRLGQRNA